MHQPLYKDLMTGKYHLPWARLHAAKDYYTMVAKLDRYPSVRVTFNMVPSLLVQLEEYASGNATDPFLELSRKDADLLEQEEKEFILYNFFMANWDTMVKAFPRFNDLLQKRGLHFSPVQAREVASTFTVTDFRDLQVLFNLAWINSSIRREDEQLRRLVAKGANFTENEKTLVLEKQAGIVASVIPKYKEALERGQIEISTTEALPDTQLPHVRKKHPEDVETQIQRAIAHHRQVFGQEPAGMWPSEGGVSDQVVGIMARHGTKWTASGEEVLAASLGIADIPRSSARRENPPGFLYRPYLMETNGESIAMVFRDRVLCDLISFTYHRWPAAKAVDDLVDRLNRIRLVTATEEGPHLVSLILDGENAWEDYQDDGQPFLDALYERLSSEPSFAMVSLGQFLDENPPKMTLQKLHPGSWIGGDFDIWIGGEEENLAWDYLDEARTALVRRQQRADNDMLDENLKKAWEEIYIAEGSDWNWWYGEHHSSANDAEFDELYRMNLRNVHELAGLKPPEELFEPIAAPKVRPAAEPVALMTPVIDGRDTNYYEWLAAGLFDVKVTGGIMHKAQSIVSRVYYGFDLEHLYMRIDGDEVLAREMQGGACLKVLFLRPEGKEIVVEIGEEGPKAAFRDSQRAIPDTDGERLQFCASEVVEMGIRFEDLGAAPGEQIEFYVILERGGLEVERCPSRGPASLSAPTREFELDNWYV
jgi:alpha-amylase/alpha-mannosidase (GH57 family)